MTTNIKTIAIVTILLFTLGTGCIVMDSQEVSATLTCELTFDVNDYNYGRIEDENGDEPEPAASITVPFGTSISVNGNVLTIDGHTYTAIPAQDTAQYEYDFSYWENINGPINASRTITAHFVRTEVGSVVPSTFNITVAPGQTWEYSPVANIGSATMSISGTASSWLTISNGTISGTAPNDSTPTQYQLIITASSTQPVQTATQTITFTVLPVLVATASPSLIYVVEGGPIPNTVSESVSLSYNGFGTGTYTWSLVTSYSYPTGLTIGTDGTIGGTALVSASDRPYRATARVTGTVDGYTQTADVAFEIMVVAPLVFTSNPLIDATISN